MTNLDTGVQNEIAESEAPVVDGQGESIEAPQLATESDEPPEPELEYFDPTEFGDQYVKMTIDGEEKSVKLNEALQGYNSNAAATKRFQEAAALKAEAADALNLAKAVQANPGLTMQVLASQAGLTVEQFLNLTPSQQADVATAQAPEPEFTDPFERALYQEQQARADLERRFEEREQRFIQQEADMALRSAVGALEQRYGATREDINNVISQAQALGVTDLSLLPMIFQSQQYQKTQVQSQTVAEAQATAKAEDDRRRQAAAQASGVVATGQSVNGTAPAPVVHPMTAEEAIRSALDAAGITD